MNTQTRIQQNAKIGEIFTEAILLKKFWVLKRSVDIEGADFLVQQRNTAPEQARNRPIALGLVQAKYFEKNNQVRIARLYVEDQNGPRPDFFAFLHTMREPCETTNYFFSSEEIVRSWSITKCAGYYYFSLTRDKHFSSYQNRPEIEILDIIADGIRQTESYQTEFMLRSFFEVYVDTRTMLPSPHCITYLLRIVEGCKIVVYRDNDTGGMRPLEPRRDLFEYSGDFSWGYSGTGPMFLAASILGHHFGGACIPSIEQQRKVVKLLGMIDNSRSYDITSENIDAILRS